jgi:hypothetical protein
VPGAPAARVDAPGDAASRRFPPMLILPLVDVAVRRARDAGARARSRSPPRITADACP